MIKVDKGYIINEKLIKVMKGYEMNSNPFTLSFGKEPLELVSRSAQTNEIIEDFTAANSSTQIYMLTGIRGTGKTVTMTTLEKEFKKREEWICIELNPERDMLMSLASKLYSEENLKKLFIKAKFDFSAFGLGASIEDGFIYTDIETVIVKMLEELKKHGKRLLVTIDEVLNNKDIRVFAAAFQIFIRHDLPIYALVTGLYENIYNLQNEKSLTFLYRAPKIMLTPLNITAVSNRYKDTLGVTSEMARELALLTKGYSFAFQVLGYLCWDNKDNLKEKLDSILSRYDEYLEEYVYEKIWNELSERDREILVSIANCDKDKVKVKDIRDERNLEPGNFSIYRTRLQKKGLIDTSQYGYVSLVLPRFADFVKRYS